MVRVRVVRHRERRRVLGTPRGTRVRTAGWARRRLVTYAWPRGRA